jgi:hypothetical protein
VIGAEAVSHAASRWWRDYRNESCLGHDDGGFKIEPASPYPLLARLNANKPELLRVLDRSRCARF